MARGASRVLAGMLTRFVCGCTVVMDGRQEGNGQMQECGGTLKSLLSD